MRATVSLTITALALCAGCNGSNEPSEPTVTYYANVKPILNANCVGCHQEGEIGVGVLDSYDAASKRSTAIAMQTINRTMPPYPPDPGCNDYVGDMSLSDEDIATLAAWADAGAPAGDPADDAGSAPAKPRALSRVDLTLAIPEPYSPSTSSPDDFRCFVMEWPATEPTYVTGVGVRPGNRTTAHHLVAFYVGAAQAQGIRDADAADPGPGYYCGGGTGNLGGSEGGGTGDGGGTGSGGGGDGGPGGGEGMSLNGTGLLAGWAPGSAPTEFPSDVGMPIEPGSVVVLQMHYNTVSWDGQPDQTELDLKLEASVAREGASVFWANPQWITQDTMIIAAGDPDASHSFAFDPTFFYTAGRPMTIFGSGLHMHTRGTRASLTVEKSLGGGSECLLDIPRWDFDWQGGYPLVRPMQLNPGDTLRVECHWDNSPENQPVIQGVKMPPKEIRWGEGTDDEMCLGALFMAPVE